MLSDVKQNPVANECRSLTTALVRAIRDAGTWSDMLEAGEALLAVQRMYGQMCGEERYMALGAVHGTEPLIRRKVVYGEPEAHA